MEAGGSGGMSHCNVAVIRTRGDGKERTHNEGGVFPETEAADWVWIYYKVHLRCGGAGNLFENTLMRCTDLVLNWREKALHNKLGPN